MGRLEGHIAVITGGAGGIGKEIAKRFSFEGAAIALLDIDKEAVGKVASEISKDGGIIMSSIIDVTNEESILNAYSNVISNIGDPDILVNSAAIAGGSELEDMSTSDWDQIMNINLRGTFLCCREIIPIMKRIGWGRIINIASEVADRGHPGLSHYAASKAAVIAMTKCLALEVVSDNIRANVLSPGPTKTQMLDGLDEITLSNLLSDLMPIGRLGKPEEIAAAAVYLASDEADFCVGTTLNINGGTYRS